MNTQTEEKGGNWGRRFRPHLFFFFFKGFREAGRCQGTWVWKWKQGGRGSCSSSNETFTSPPTKWATRFHLYTIVMFNGKWKCIYVALFDFSKHFTSYRWRCTIHLFHIRIQIPSKAWSAAWWFKEQVKRRKLSNLISHHSGKHE